MSMRGTGRSRTRTFLNRMNSLTSRTRSATHRFSSASSEDFPDLNTIQRSSSRTYVNKKKSPRVVGGLIKSKGIFQKWQFSATTSCREDLKRAAVEMLEYAFTKLHYKVKGRKLSDLMTTAMPAITEFVDTIESHYNESAFHSFIHAVDVAQLMYTLLEEFFVKKIRNEEYFYLIVAALCHDINHPGVTAGTLKKLGLLSDDMSLEDYHVQKTVELFEEGKLELICNEKLLSSTQRLELIRYSRMLIEATDIGKHTQYVAAVSDKVESGHLLGEEHLAILMKVADLANISRDFTDSCKWSENFKIEMAAEKEFLENEDIEKFKQLNLPRDDVFKILSNNIIARQQRIRRDLVEQNALSKGTSKTTLNFMKLFAFPLVSCLDKMNTSGASIYGVRIRQNQQDWLHLNL